MSSTDMLLLTDAGKDFLEGGDGDEVVDGEEIRAGVEFFKN